MKRIKHSPDQIISKLRKADELQGAGKSAEDIAKALGVTVVTYYRWRRQFSGVDHSEAKRLRELDKENQRLKKLVADQALDIQILKEVIEGKH
jgi:putative transposase